MLRLCARGAAVAALALVVGCGKGTVEPEKLAVSPARGIVTYKGQPLGDATVGFISLDNKIRAHGKTDGVGSFVLSTYGTNDGIPPGKYRVTVAVSGTKEIEPGVLAPEPEGGFKSPIPTKYANPATTTILEEVKADGKNEFLIKLN